MIYGGQEPPRNDFTLNVGASSRRSRSATAQRPESGGKMTNARWKSSPRPPVTQALATSPDCSGRFDNLPATRNMCLKRAKGLKRRMEANAELTVKLQSLIDEYKAKGLCREVSRIPPHHPTWNLPVFPVLNSNKPEKTRLVWDAAAKVNGRSLNSSLLTGLDLLTPLPEVLMRFRERKVGVTADVSAMFHQVAIREEDRDAQRFLWCPVDSDRTEEYRMEVMIFGASRY